MSQLCARKLTLRCIDIVRLDLRDDGPDIQGYLSQLTNQRSVPNVFISELAPYAISKFLLTRMPQSPDQKHIGGA